MGAVGCSASTSVQTTALQQPPRPLVPRPPEAIEIFSKGPPAEPYVDVALFEVEGTRGLDAPDTYAMIWSLRERAGEIGCDAVVLEHTSEPVGPQTEAMHEVGDRDADALLASCIVYRHPVLPAQAANRRLR